MRLQHGQQHRVGQPSSVQSFCRCLEHRRIPSSLYERKTPTGCSTSYSTLSCLQWHKQGIGSLDEVERAILEPGGSICFFAKTPTPEASRHKELMAELQTISTRLAALESPH